MLCIGFVLSLIAGRLVQLQAMEGSVYRAKADSWRLATIPVPAVRGSITSADGTTLAMTVQTDLVHADPPLITQAKKSFSAVASALAGPLGMSAAAILAKLENPTSKDYVMLKKSVPATTAAAITALNEPGIAMTPSYTREYPNGDLAANLIGFTNTNGAGVLTGEAGIEQADNSLLAGRPGQQEVQVGTNDQPIPVAGQTTRQMVPGDNVRLTILASLQWEAEQACAQEVKKTDASNCTVVIMQPSTGKILAMAQSPSFNPAHPANVAGTTDIPVANVFDPGSTAKVITASAALEHGGQTPMSAYTVPESINFHGYSFHDAEYHPTREMDHRRDHRPLQQRGHGPGGPARQPADAVPVLQELRHRPAERARRCPRRATASCTRRPSGGVTSGTPWRSARVSRSPRSRWPASTPPSPTAGSG